MKIPLSPRLQACAGYVSPGDRIADIGCDHGYLGLYLISNNIASSVIAADINPMPLQSAKQNFQKYGYFDRVSFYLSDGVKNIPHNFDTMICAGMGADTIISILASAPWLKSEHYRLILQCQSKTPMLRRFLSDNGWFISEESVLRDGKFLYTVMEVLWQPDKPRLTESQTHFPPALLENPSKEVPSYYKWVLEGIRIQAERQNDPVKLQIYNELRELPNNPALSFLSEE